MIASCMGMPSSSRWWSDTVFCAQLDEVMWKGPENKETAYFGRMVEGYSKYVRLTWKDLTGPPYHLFWECLHKPVVAFTEIDEAWFSWQPSGLITYHAFVIMEVEKAGWFGEKLFIMIERCSDSLQLLFGRGKEAHVFIQQFYTSGRQRNVSQCTKKPRRAAHPDVTVYALIKWLDTCVSKAWRNYGLVTNNCQHFVAEVQKFLLDPHSVMPASTAVTEFKGCLSAMSETTEHVFVKKSGDAESERKLWSS